MKYKYVCAPKFVVLYPYYQSYPSQMRTLFVLSFFLSAFGANAQNFRVQAAAFADSVGRNYFTDRGIQGVTVVHSKSGIWQYLVGSYKTREEAEAIQEQLIAKGFANPVILDLEAERVIAGSKCAYDDGRTTPDQEEDGLNPVRKIYFATGKSLLDAAARTELDRFIVQMKANTALQLRIMGFTDSDGDAEDNQQIAAARAKAARNYLINKGIRADRMFVEVYGETDPLYDNKDYDGNVIKQNQRWNNRVMLKYKE